jgi:hypothetical protein
MIYRNQVGRIALEVREPRDGGKAELIIPDGWNDSVPKIRNVLTREELHDLRYLIDRALTAIEARG